MPKILERNEAHVCLRSVAVHTHKLSCRLGSPKPDHNFQNRFSVLEAVKTGFPVLVRFWHFFLYKGVITRYNAVIGIENASIRLHRPIMIIKHSHYDGFSLKSKNGLLFTTHSPVIINPQ